MATKTTDPRGVVAEKGRARQLGSHCVRQRSRTGPGINMQGTSYNRAVADHRSVIGHLAP